MRDPTAPLNRLNPVPIAGAAIGLLCAIVLGAIVANPSFWVVVFVCAILGVLLFVTILYRFTWQISLLLIFSGFGFWFAASIGGSELSCALGIGLIALFFWHKQAIPCPDVLRRNRAFGLMQRAIFLWLIFSLLHFYFSYKLPFRPEDFTFRNGIKPYFTLSAPLLLLYYFSKKPGPIFVRENFFWRISQLCFGAVVINLFVRLWDFAGLPGLQIPVIHGEITPLQFRTLGPFSMLLGIVAVTSPATRTHSMIKRLVYWSLLLFGTLGSLMSGGRGTIVAGFALVVFVLWYRRRIAALIVAAAGALIAVAFLNLFADVITRHASEDVQRSIQWLMVRKNWEVNASIDSSSRWRGELARRAVEDWRSSPRTFWLGRATYGFGLDDVEEVRRKGGYEALLDISLRRGATHNLTTDLLVAYGLIGLLLFCLMYFSLVLFLWRLHKAAELSQSAADLALTCWIVSVANLVMEVIGTGTLRPELAWCMIVLIAAIYKGVALRAPERQGRSPGNVLAPVFALSHRA